MGAHVVAELVGDDRPLHVAVGPHVVARQRSEPSVVTGIGVRVQVDAVVVGGRVPALPIGRRARGRGHGVVVAARHELRDRHPRDVPVGVDEPGERGGAVRLLREERVGRVGLGEDRAPHVGFVADRRLLVRRRDDEDEDALRAGRRRGGDAPVGRRAHAALEDRRARIGVGDRDRAADQVGGLRIAEPAAGRAVDDAPALLDDAAVEAMAVDLLQLTGERRRLRHGRARAAERDHEHGDPPAHVRTPSRARAGRPARCRVDAAARRPSPASSRSGGRRRAADSRPAAARR